MRRRSELWPVLLLAGMFAVAALVRPWLPDIVPTRWWDGEATSFAGRGIAVLIMPVMAVGFYGALWLITHSYDEPILWLTRLGVVATFFLVFIEQLVAFAGYRPHPTVPLGIVVTALGFVLPSLPRNGVIGVRTRWTLASDRAWTRSNRVGGGMFVAIGATSILAGLFQVDHALAMTLAALVVVVVSLVCYSYLEWRRDPDAAETAG
jgi:uncharacterized membrane protein